MVRCLLISALLLAAGCGPKAPLRPPDLEAAYRRIEAEPNRAEGYLELARQYFRRGDTLRARQYLAIAERYPIKDLDGAFRLGLVIAVRGGLYDEAVLRCRRTLERKEDPRVRELLSSMLEATGRWGDAEIERQLVLAAQPEEKHQLIELARFYQRWGRADAEQRATELYRRYLEEAPTGSDAAQARAALRALALTEQASRRTE